MGVNGQDKGYELEQHYAVYQLAERFNVHRNTVISWIDKKFFPNAKRMPKAKGLGQWRVPASDVEAFVSRLIAETHKA